MSLQLAVLCIKHFGTGHASDHKSCARANQLMRSGCKLRAEANWMSDLAQLLMLQVNLVQKGLAVQTERSL